MYYILRKKTRAGLRRVIRLLSLSLKKKLDGRLMNTTVSTGQSRDVANAYSYVHTNTETW